MVTGPNPPAADEVTGLAGVIMFVPSSLKTMLVFAGKRVPVTATLVLEPAVADVAGFNVIAGGDGPVMMVPVLLSTSTGATGVVVCL